VAVGLLDTGIAPVDDLAGRVVARADLSGEHSFTDAYGHGTFMAGLIAGTGRDGGPAGAAPGASLVDLRVAGADGSTTLAQVLRGLQLADANRATLHLAVLNLSLSVPADDPAAAPLTEAVERLWADGVTVVAAAGNDGHGVAAPGLDPYVVTAGALDPATGTVPAWSGRGRDFAGRSKPDLLAPGVGVVGPRAAGSTVDAAHPSARVGRAYLRGSGTSMATAVVSGVAARLAAAHPGWGPDEIKAALLAGADRPGGGPGVVDLAGALAVWRAAPANADLYRLRPAAAAATATSWATGQWLARSDAARSWQRHGLAAGTAAPAWAARQWAWGGAAAPRWAGREWAGREWAGREWAGREWAVHGWGAG
jgi:serine protease AprX